MPLSGVFGPEHPRRAGFYRSREPAHCNQAVMLASSQGDSDTRIPRSWRQQEHVGNLGVFPELGLQADVSKMHWVRDEREV